MQFIPYVILAFLLFAVIIMIHELGHMLVAKWMGVGVVEYAIGMGPSLFMKRKGDTCYSIRAIPLGGFCALYGERSAEAAGKGDAASNVNPMYKTDWSDRQSLSKRPWYQRALIYLAGPMFNILFGLICAILLSSMVGGYGPCTIAELTPTGSAAAQGIQVGDVIVGINDRDITLWSEYVSYKETHPQAVADGYALHVMRGNERLIFDLTTNADGLVGITIDSNALANGIFDAFRYGLIVTRYLATSVFDGFGMLVRGEASLGDMMGILGATGAMSSSMANAAEMGGFSALVSVLCSLGALMSINLGIMNMLPVPALDGGRLLFCLLEGVSRRKIPEKVEMVVNTVGLMAMMLLMTFIMGNDIRKMLMDLMG